MSKAKEIMERLDAIDPNEAIGDNRRHYAYSTLNALADAIVGGEECVRSFQENIIYVRNALRDAFAELESRAMPEGMEWPRYEDGEPVNIVGPFVDHEGEAQEVRVIEFNEGGFRLVARLGSYDWHDHGERVKRHAPKVLDADGVEIRVGDTVWDVFGNRRFEVLAIEDGERDGYIVKTVGIDRMRLEGLSKPSDLTHKRPDSWERIEADCSKCCIEYCDEHGLLDHGCNAAEGDASTRHCTDCGDSCEERMARDLVRRAKALAGVSE